MAADEKNNILNDGAKLKPKDFILEKYFIMDDSEVNNKMSKDAYLCLLPVGKPVNS